jgi:hypothetical protein
MPTSWYSISIFSLESGGGIFDGYFSVDNDTNLVTAFYETIDGLTNFNNNILGPNPFPPPLDFYTAQNTYTTDNWGDAGTNISSVTLQSAYNSDTPYFNIYGNNILRGLDLTNNITINQISDPSCFNEGTKILCLNKNLEEEYIPIENLRKGDLVKSYKHGYRKIDLIGKNPMINNPDKINECMYKMEKTEENGLIEDLIVTGGHSILVDDLRNYKDENDKKFGGTQIIDDKYLLLSSVSNDFKKLENNNLYTYYHFILENNGNDDERFGVWANGILTETPSKNQFTNHKYTLL